MSPIGSIDHISTRHKIIVVSGWGRLMDYDDYLREEAAKYRHLAEQANDDFIRKELLELALVCEEVANAIEDRLTGG